MTLLTLIDAELAYGLTPLLDRANLTVEDGERIGLIGRNGTGKSSLLGVLAARVALDDGTVHRRDGLRVAVASAPPSRSRSRSIRSCCCSTNPRTTSTSTASRGSRNCCRGSGRACS